MLKLTHIMNLSDPFLSAASGVVRLNDYFYLVGDDQNCLFIYDLKKQSGTRKPIFQEKLPIDTHQKKKVKGDFEALLHLPDQKQLMVIPSGSTSLRERGAYLNEQGDFLAAISFSALYQQLRKEFPQLNIEGGLVHLQELWFFQRGNGRENHNGLIRISLESFLQNAPVMLSCEKKELGQINGIPLTFTDATCWENKIVFLAVAENTSSTYLDGHVEGSVLGLMNGQGEILAVEALDLTSKPEGITIESFSSSFFLVTDDDSPDLASSMWQGELPAEWKRF